MFAREFLESSENVFSSSEMVINIAKTDILFKISSFQMFIQFILCLPCNSCP